MQGIYISNARPRSKKAIREAVASDPHTVRIEATSMFGDEYDGPVSGMPVGTVVFVGPDPYTKRKFYGQLIRTRDGRFNVK